MYTARKNMFFYQKVALFFNEKAYICKKEQDNTKMYIIGIAGGTGLGKATAVKEIVNSLPRGGDNKKAIKALQMSIGYFLKQE